MFDALRADYLKMVGLLEKSHEGTHIITTAEVSGWYLGVAELLQSKFGAESREACVWKEGMARADDEIHNRIGKKGFCAADHKMYVAGQVIEQIRLLQMDSRRPSDTAESLKRLRNELQVAASNTTYSDDLLASMHELAACFEGECYIACLCLAGKLLEISLKQLLTDHNISFSHKHMLGELLGRMKNRPDMPYLDPGLHELATIINKSRIPAVHAKERVPVPSREQAEMAIHATLDTLRRVLIR